jgi:serine/threonine-protein kinase
MSPEQMRSARTVDARSDIWALGTVLYELVEGQVPFDANNFAELCVLVSTEPPTPMKAAPQLEDVVRKCLAKSCDDRFPSVAELAHALQPFATDPERAKRQVTKIYRVLGKEPPDRSDPSSPSFVDITAVRSAQRDRLTSTIVKTISRNARSRPELVVLGALLMIGIGIGGGLWYTHHAGNTPEIDVGLAPDPAAAEATPELLPSIHIVDRAGLAPSPPPPAPVVVPDRVTVRKPPRRPPPHPPVRPPVARPPPASPKCDPFDARNKC